MDESSLEQQIREPASYTLIVRKTGALGLVQLGLTAGRPAVCDEIILALKIFKIR